MSRRISCAIIVNCGLFTLLHAAPAMAAGWIDGGIGQTSGSTCNGSYAVIAQHLTSYYGESGGTSPEVGQVYGGRAVYATTNNVCAGTSVLLAVRVTLPYATEFAIDAQNPVRCYLTSDGGQTVDVTNDPNMNCTQEPEAWGLDQWHFGSRYLPAGSTFQIMFPLVSSAVLNREQDGSYSQLAAFFSTSLDTTYNGTSFVYVSVAPATPDSTVRGDFGGDGKGDILLRDSDGNIGMWMMNGATIVSGAFVGSPGGTYSIAGIADFGGDGMADILLRDDLGNLGLWTMNGSTITSGAFVGSPGGSYTVVGTADFNGDGKGDILLRDNLGNLGMWMMNGPVISAGAYVGSPGGSYTVVGTADFGGDGKADILLRDTLGNLGMWTMNGATITSGAFVGAPGGSYSVAAVADFSGDGKADILLRDHLGNLGMWIMNGATIASGAFVGAPGDYTVSAATDYSGDGKADILLRDSAGNLGMWIMNGPVITSGAFVGSPGPGYVAY